MNLPTLIDKFELNPTKYSNLELVLFIFDKVYENKKFIINISNDESCILIIKFVNVIVEGTYEVKLYENK